MASQGGNKLLEGKEGSYDSISNSGSSSEQEPMDKNNRGLSESCPAVLEPSKDESRRFDGRSRNLTRKLLTRSCPEPSTQDVSISSSSESHSNEDEQQRSVEQGNNEVQINEPVVTHRPNRCATFMDCYNKYARKIGNSWFIYVFQFFLFLLCVSAVILGMVFFRNCEGEYPSTDPLLIMLMAISCLFLIYKWSAKVRRQRRGDHFWNREKNRLIMYLAVLLFLMTLEFMFFTQISPKGMEGQSTKVQCSKTYYDYLYNLHIVNAGALVFAALLYLPDCCIHMYTYRRLVPSQANGHYQPL